MTNTVKIHLLLLCLTLTDLCGQTFKTNHNAALVLLRPTFEAGGASGPISSANALDPQGIAVHPQTGRIWISDAAWHRVTSFSPFPELTNGNVATIFLGQANYVSSSSGHSSQKANNPGRLTIGPDNNLILVDRLNHRLLVFANANILGFFPVASQVIGQSLFNTNASGITSSALESPTGAFVASNGDLWVADGGNNRVLRFPGYVAQGNGPTADLVLGQALFTTDALGSGADEMAFPTDLLIDSAGTLWVVDQGNNRILKFPNAAGLGNGAPATVVLGQAGFGTNLATTTATGFFGPNSIAMTPGGRLYVSDINNHRVVWFDNVASLPSGSPASGVLGQNDFTSNESATTRNRIRNPDQIALDSAGRLYVTQGFPARAVVFAPSPTIAVSGKKKVVTTKSRQIITGTSTALAGAGSVQWRIGKKGWKPAAGITSWRIKAKLSTGRNKIFVRSTDQAGMTSPEQRVTVIRR